MSAVWKDFSLAVKVRESSFGLLVGVNGVVSGPESLVGRGFGLSRLEHVLVGREGFFQYCFVESFGTEFNFVVMFFQNVGFRAEGDHGFALGFHFERSWSSFVVCFVFLTTFPRKESIL